MYKRNSAVKFGKTSRKVKTLTTNQKEALSKHRNNHIQQNNPIDMINKHMRVMRDLMKGGDSFNKSHIEAQKLYPMKQN